MEITTLKTRFASLKPTLPCDWYGLRYVREVTTERSVRDGKPELCQTAHSEGAMLEALVDGQFAYAATADLSPNALQKTLAKALKLAKAASVHKVFHFTKTARPKSIGTYTTPVQTPFDQFANTQIWDHLKLCSEAVRINSHIISAQASSRLVTSHHILLTSDGGCVEQNFSLSTFDLMATAQNGNITQTRSNGGLRGQSHQMGAECFDLQKHLQTAKSVGEEACELAFAEVCPEFCGDLLLAPDQMMLQIHESIGHPLEYDRILGDEKNYAGWSFVKPTDFGTLQYGSPILNVTFDPTLPNEFASYGFDDSGFAAKKEYIIQNGKLLRGLGGLESQQRLGLAGTANFRAASWNRAPIDRMANLNVEVGTSSWQDMVASIERGVFMTSNNSWSIDDYRNKFQFGCEYAKLIENGKITKTVRNPNYRGITVPFWNQLKKVGDHNTFEIYGTPYCGKGEPNQIIRVGHASPTCLFANVEIFGGVA